MFITPEELNTSLYDHVISDITEGDSQIVQQSIDAAVLEVKSYLASRYNVAAIFSAQGDDRDALVVENTKVVAVWNLIKLSSSETIYDNWRERYDRVIAYLTQIADGRISPDLPLKTGTDGEVIIRSKFGSNPKFTHDV